MPGVVSGLAVETKSNSSTPLGGISSTVVFALIVSGITLLRYSLRKHDQLPRWDVSPIRPGPPIELRVSCSTLIAEKNEEKTDVIRERKRSKWINR